MPGKMYFGNKARMTFVKCPDSGMGMNGSRYSAEGTFLNGGAYVRNSATGHRSYDMSWNFLRADEKDEIRAYLDGVYGSGLLHFLDPFAMRRNVLPTCWASPGVAVDGGPSLVGGMANAPTAAQGPFGGTTLRTNYVRNPRPAGANSGDGVTGFARYGPGGGETGVTMTTDAPLNTAVVRTNLATNPSFEAGLADVSVSGDITTAHDTTVAFVGTKSLRCTVGSTPSAYTYVGGRFYDITPGTYTGMSLRVRTATPTARPYRARVLFYDASNTQVGSAGAWGTVVTPASGVWAEVRTGVDVAPATAVKARAYVYQGDGTASSATAGVIFNVDARYYAVGATAADVTADLDAGYFDGATATRDASGSRRYGTRWTSTANNSTSEEYLTITPGALTPNGTGFARRVVTATKTSGSTGWQGRTSTYYAYMSGAAGEKVTISMLQRWVGSDVPKGTRLRAEFFNASGASLGISDGPATDLPPDAWVTLSHTMAAPADYAAVGWWTYQLSYGDSQILTVGGAIDCADVLIEKTDTVKPWFDGASTPATNPRVKSAMWNGTANDSSSTAEFWDNARINLVTDPRATNSARWVAAPGTGGAVSETMVTGASDGPTLPDGTKVTTYARYAWTTASTGGTPYAGPLNTGVNLATAYPPGTLVDVSIFVRVSAAHTATVSLGTRLDDTANGGGSRPTPDISLPAGQWVNLSALIPADAEFDFAVPRATFWGQIMALGETVDVTAAMAVPGVAQQGLYFDGATPDTSTVDNRWSGAANNSPSVQASVTEGSPRQGATYNLESGTVFKDIWVPIPPGHTLHLTSEYAASGTAAVSVTPDNGSAITLPSDGSAVSVTGSGATLKLAGTGTISLGFMMAQVWPNGQGPDFSRFYPGTGHSGARLSGDINDVGYSSPQALDFSALSFTLREVGSWE